MIYILTCSIKPLKPIIDYYLIPFLKKRKHQIYLYLNTKVININHNCIFITCIILKELLNIIINTQSLIVVCIKVKCTERYIRRIKTLKSVQKSCIIPFPENVM